MSRFARLLLLAAAAALLSGCELLGIESPERVAAAREADGKAIGGACRHAARAIEDCYALYRKADRAAIFAGWRDMNDYMRENKIEPVEPQVASPSAGASSGGAAPGPVEVARKAPGGRGGDAPAKAATPP